jgi:hypothetical protein
MGYSDARTAHIHAANDLYGSGSIESLAVQNSFHAINVGDAGASNLGYATVFVVTML